MPARACTSSSASIARARARLRRARRPRRLRFCDARAERAFLGRQGGLHALQFARALRQFLVPGRKHLAHAWDLSRLLVERALLFGEDCTEAPKLRAFLAQCCFL